LLDYLHEVDHVAARIGRLEAAIDAAVQTAPARMRAVIEAWQALRGIALVTAVTIAAEVGELSRFAKPRQLMGYTQRRVTHGLIIAVGRVIRQARRFLSR